MILSIISAGLIAFILKFFGILNLNKETNPIFVIMYTFVFSGIIISTILSRRSVKPIRDMMKATDKVSKEDFSIKVNGSFVMELDSLAVSFNKMVQELKSIETLRNDFVGNFSHEFKTPISSISGFAKLLKEKDISENEKHDYLNSIIQESERLVELSTNVLNLSKIENTEIMSDVTTYILDEQIRLVILMLESKWKAKDIYIDIMMEENIEIVGNKNLIHQIWVNLLDNAIKFSSDGGTLKIGLWKVGQSAIFRIEDNGCGIQQETIDRIFEKFFQEDTSHATTGNGLGLTLTKKIVELSKGNIEVSSKIGVGTIFTIKLPIQLYEETKFL
jgi:signal transduction histidine kinase